jgi:hypothetical protein
MLDGLGNEPRADAEAFSLPPEFHYCERNAARLPASEWDVHPSTKSVGEFSDAA